MSNNSNLSSRISVTPVTIEFRSKLGHIGRPRKNSKVIVNLSEMQGVIEEVGVKAVRLAVFASLRSQLGIDPGCVIVEHPKKDGTWVLKSEALGFRDIFVNVSEVI